LKNGFTKICVTRRAILHAGGLALSFQQQAKPIAA
jgi:hypothetical protein